VHFTTIKYTLTSLFSQSGV